MNQAPLISVLLPVYNAEKYLAKSIQSILNQTYQHFELIILNDGSVDDSEKIALSFTDQRIVYVKHANCGLAATLNKGLQLAKGSLIARQDNDDISLPNRFKEQVAFFSANPNLVLLGTAAEIVNEKGDSSGRFHQHPCNNIDLKWALLFNNPFVHSSVMFKKAEVIKCGAYSLDKHYFEDYHLWSRLSVYGEVANLSECFLKYREVNSGMSKTTSDYLQRVKNQSLLNVAKYCPDLDTKKLKLFVDFNFGEMSDQNSKQAENVYLEVLTTLAEAFCLHEKVNIHVLTEAIKRQKIQVKRYALNYVLQSKTSTTFAKLKAKVLRKILFTLYRKYL